jgi:hypothetical protein
MFIVFDDRPSDAPFVERVWTSYSERAGDFLSVASPHWEMVVTRLRGQTCLIVRGPETHATMVPCPPEGEWVGIRFKFGTFLRRLPPGLLADHRNVTLPGAGVHSFWLNGSAWEFPTFENADVFVARLARKGLLAQEPSVDACRGSEPGRLSPRSLQRHVMRATGITNAAFRSIQRARYATMLLRDGVPILDVVQRAGYFDQPHLSRSLARLIGQTPAQIARHTEQLSFLYKTRTGSQPV